ncbi:unnamed protein product [Bemisia tabaci]|uniref:Adenine phosphoribosyltransferase n=1 Tax=Bemisia tabaci TaxID=7038 RepID=A0A9P0EYA2_BEMTA|nr:PREDICTED: adenine phosphoribosyltransferase [Bemisia tabaci]CAH0380881.1 unnamed protein product [Bemisia tabaci]
MDSSSREKKIEILKSLIQEYPDFPKQGILFRDLFSVFKNVEALQILQELIFDHTNSLSKSVDVVAALESRGFLIGPLIAIQLKVPFVPIRKPGKLPGNVQKVDFELEYGSDSFEVQIDSIKEGQGVLLVDDLLATGGSLEAASKLLTSKGAKVVENFVIMELCDLKGRSRLTSPVHSLVKY